MTVNNQTRKVTATGNGSATSFSFSPMVVFAASELVVVTTVIATGDETVRTEGTGANNWSIAISDFPATGSITYPADEVTPLPATETITIKRVLVLEQATNLNNRGGYFSETQEDTFDKLLMIDLQQQEELDRGIKMPLTTSTSFTAELDGTPSANAGKVLGVSSDGLSMVFYSTISNEISVSSFMETVLDDVDGDAAMATLLAGVAAMAGVRSDLGLGGAAVEGVASGGVADLLRADGDGSTLTGIVSGASDGERANIMLNAFRISVNGGLTVQNMADGVVDEFEDETGVDTVTSANETYDASGDFYWNPLGVGSQIAQGTGTAIGDMTATGGLAAAFDSNTSQATTAGASKAATTNAYIGKDYSAAAQSISQVKVYSSTNSDFTSGVGAVTLTLRGKNGSPPSAYNDGTSLGSVVHTNTSSQNILTIASDNDGPWDYAWVSMEYGSSISLYMCEVEFYNATPPSNMTLVSEASAALAQPDTGYITLWQEDVDSATINTDLTVEVSRDGGVTWDLITLAAEATLASGRVLAGSVTLTSTGTSMKYRIKTLNAKSQKIHAVGLEWS